MNESLAKQLHDLCGRWKIITTQDVDTQIRANMNEMQEELHKIIEQNRKETNQNNNK